MKRIRKYYATLYHCYCDIISDGKLLFHFERQLAGNHVIKDTSCCSDIVLHDIELHNFMRWSSDYIRCGKSEDLTPNYLFEIDNL